MADRNSIVPGRNAPQRRMFIGVLAFAIVVGLIGWLKQDYLREQVRQFVTIRPYMETQVRPYVLIAAAERALKPGSSFKEGLPRDGGRPGRGIYHGIARQ